MKSRAFLLAAALAVAGCFRGGGTEDTNDITVSGQLIERNEKPVAGARVLLVPETKGSGEAESTLTDRRGYYALHAAPGRYVLEIFAKPVGGSERNVARREIVLQPDRNLVLPPVSAVLALYWDHRAGLSLDASAAVSGTVTGFPMLVRLSGTSFPGDAQGDGKDIRFAKPDGSPVAYELERWDAASRQAEVWVRMDTVKADTGAAIWMYWGNRDAEDASHGASVFDSASGFAGAWHAHWDSGSASASLPDASAARNTGAFQGTAPMVAAEAAIGRGISCDGVDQYLATANPHSDPDVFTLSLWFRADTAGGKLAGLESASIGRGTFFDRQIWLDDDGHLRFGIFTPAPAVLTAADSPYVRLVKLPGEDPDMPDIERTVASPGTYADGAWHQVTAVLSPEGQSLYVDGALAATEPANANAAAFTGYWRFGGGSMGDWVGRSKKDFFKGMIDEPSVALRARSAAWIRLAWLTQAPGTSRLLIRNEY